MGLFLTQQNKLFFTSKLVCAAFFVPQGLLICLRMKKKNLKILIQALFPAPVTWLQSAKKTQT